ncbi:hypothetical protein FC21_GL001180 [Limosilactobacillus equigenerosi DSM 18793 = JCM 14505]|uniref:Uncharacterized protein n=2 Tax=Limosilactobacillus TaxID=2742598 RepID=A0A0R1UZ29_9LACO|nr:hypothetical protein FC21_GL001180 [Limosilactobacillus equigenerosi DSM 18793 = JCM 14505]
MATMNEVVIATEYITIGQLLKEEGLIPTGGAAKWFLAETPVWVNDEQDQRRGRKLYPGDEIQIDDQVRLVIKAQEG